MSSIEEANFHGAIEDFRRARRRAALQKILARLRGRSDELLAYEDVRQMLKAEETVPQGLQRIPLDAIVGSVGRQADFTRTFLPRRASNEERWARVKFAMDYAGGLPPIEVYQVGDAYFVLDGNHRVSVARQAGESHIDAYVTEVKTKVPLTPDDQPDELICKARYADFLERTRLDELRPGANLYLTVCGRFRDLEEEIEIYRYLLAAEKEGEVLLEEAAVHWYDKAYLPVVQTIRERGILRDFPGRTETDLYLWLVRWQEELEKELGWQVETGTAALEMAAKESPRPQRILARMSEKLREVVMPQGLEAGPEPGQWRQERVAARRMQGLFIDILVLIEETDQAWQALAQALRVAELEEGQLRGLHVAESREGLAPAQRQALEAEFERRCREADIEGQIAFEQGKTTRKISAERARWTDLVVVKLDYPPGVMAVDRLNSPVGRLIRRSARPLLVVPERASRLARPLLAYDGSPNAREALFVATYMAADWAVPLTVLTVSEAERADQATLAEAQAYLESYGLKAVYLNKTGPVAEMILQTAAEQDSDLIIMGGYGFSPMLEVVLGSAVDQVLRESERPVLICH